MPATRAVEPVATILALRIRKPLLALALGTLAIHLAAGDVILEDQATLGAHLGITAMIRGFTSRRRACEDRMTMITPILAASLLFTDWAFFQRHHNNSIDQGPEQS